MVALTFDAPFDAAFYGGGSVTTDLVPHLFDVALNGRPFMVQLQPDAIEKWGQHFARESLPLVRDQSDQSDEPGEQSVSPEQFWRRSQQTWHKGAGQPWLDWPGADRDRFRSSKGVNVWTQKQASLLNTTSRTKTSANNGLRLCMAGSRVYLADGQALSYSTDAASWTAVTATPVATVSSVASDGFNVYAAYNASGIYKTDTSTGAAAAYITGTIPLVAYVKGRIMCADNAGAIYNPTAPPALGTALFTHHAGAQFSWVGFADGPGFIYAAGFSGGRSEIYSITITDTATALGAPTIAETLPEGEIVRSIRGYLGFLLIGSDKGVRMATINSDGSLILGGLINTNSSVQCFDVQDRFVWFGWTNYDTVSTGLGRVDLSVFTTTLVPAYASDLMVTAQGTVGSTVLLGAARLYTVDGYGVVKETVGTPVTSGTLSTGFIGYDLVDEKQAVFLDVRHEPLPTSAAVAVALAADNGAFTTVGTSASTGATSPAAFYLNGQRAERFEVQVTLTAAGSAPTLTRWTLRADVTPQPSSVFLVPLIISDTLNVGGHDRDADPYNDLQALFSLHDDQTIFPYQQGVDTYQVKLVEYAWLPQQRSADTPGVFSGTFVAQLRHITG